MPLIHDVSESHSYSAMKKWNGLFVFFFFQNFIQNFKCNDDGALGDQKNISLMK